MNNQYCIKTIRNEINQMPHFLTVKEVASFLRIAERTIYELVYIGEIDATKIRGAWRIPRSALLEYLEKKHPFNWED